jgi:hypothetical protein
MDAQHDEPRYTVRELFDMFLAFNRDPRERQRMYKQNLSPQQHAMPLIVQFIAYVRNQDFERAMKAWDAELERLAEKHKERLRMFGEPTDGTLFTEEP